MKNKGKTQTRLKNVLKLATKTFPRTQTQQREIEMKLHGTEAIGQGV